MPCDIKGRLYPNPAYRRTTPHYPSHDSGSVNTLKPVEQEYTGTYVRGIGVLHKSNLVPVTSPEYAKQISKMRR